MCSFSLQIVLIQYVGGTSVGSNTFFYALCVLVGLPIFHSVHFITRLKISEGWNAGYKFPIKNGIFREIKGLPFLDEKFKTLHCTTDYGCPMKPFLLKSRTFGLGRQIGQINSRAFGVFSAKPSALILVLWVPCSCFPLFNHYFYKK